MEQLRIQKHHLFSHQGLWHVINIERMSSIVVEEDAARSLQKVASDPDSAWEPHLRELLRRLDLIADDKKPSEKVAKNPRQQAVPIVNMSLFLTQSCNLKCIYCYGDGGNYGDGGVMDEQTAFSAVDWLLELSGNMKVVHICFFGGEPFLNFPLMKKVVEYAQRRVSELGKMIDFNVTTNGTLLDDEKIEFIRDNQIHVMISFDGPKELQDVQRPFSNGGGSYDSIVPKIKKLLAVSPETPGHAVLVGDNDPELIKSAMKKTGFSEISISPVSKSLSMGKKDAVTIARDTRRFFHSMEQEAATWVRLVKERDSDAIRRLKAMGSLYVGVLALLHNIKKSHSCGAGLGLAAVSISGDVYLCHRFVGKDEYKIGAIYDKNLNRDSFQKSPLAEGGPCTACFAKYYCAGGCKHDNAGSSGSFAIPSEDLCRLKCRELELAATVICQLSPEDKAFLLENDIFPHRPCPIDF